jgi:anti-sigma B factor antagonist
MSIVAGNNVITVEGDLDLATAPALRQLLHDRIDDGEMHLILDLSRLDFLDSSGLGVLVGAARRVRTELAGTMTLRSPSPSVVRLLELTRLGHVFAVETDG